MKRYILSLISILFCLALIPNLASADQMGPDGDKFYEAAASFSGACGEDTDCKAPFQRKILYSTTPSNDFLTSPIQQSLYEVAYHQAQIWADTILEGDYVAAGDLHIEEVEAYYRDAELLGYKIRYAESAWNTANCAYDGSEDSLKDCEQGQISEVSYVSPDMQTFFTDEEQYAEFESL